MDEAFCDILIEELVSVALKPEKLIVLSCNVKEDPATISII